LVLRNSLGAGRPVNHTLNHGIYEALRGMIAAGDLVPGERIDERAIAERLGVSRTPLREATAKLAKEGLVEQRPYRGNFVRAFSVKQVNDLYETRMVLEGLATRRAVANLTEADLADLTGMLDAAQAALAAGDLEGFSAADQRFHSAIARLAGNEILIESLERLRAQIQLVRLAANRDPDLVERTARERPLILAALAARDADRAGTLMEEHIDGVRRSMVAHLGAADAGR
jgi:DNA-binding GntR family transcriptional regulator